MSTVSAGHLQKSAGLQAAAGLLGSFRYFLFLLGKCSTVNKEYDNSTGPAWVKPLVQCENTNQSLLSAALINDQR